MADPYTFTFDVDAFLSGQEVEKETPPEGVMKRPAKEAEAKSDTPTESLMTRLATALKGTFPDSPALGATPKGDNTSGRNKALTDWTISTEAFIPKYRGDVPAAMALQASPVTTTDMGPDMGTLAMQDAQEQSAIRSVTGITESLGRPQPTAMTDVAGLTAMPEADADVTLPSTDSVSDMYPTQGLMSPPVQDTISEIDTDTSTPVPAEPVDPSSRLDTKGSKVTKYDSMLSETGAEQTKGIQGVLTELGYVPRGIDGVSGAGTVAALRSFQEANDLPITGTADTATVAKLKASSKERYTFSETTNTMYNEFADVEADEAHLGSDRDVLGITLAYGIVPDSGLKYEHRGTIINLPRDQSRRWEALTSAGVTNRNFDPDKVIIDDVVKEGVKRGDYRSDEEWTKAVITAFEDKVKARARALDVDLSDEAKESLVSYTWNTGSGTLDGDSLTTAITELGNENPDYQNIANGFLNRFTQRRGGIMQSLGRRRANEANTLLNAVDAPWTIDLYRMQETPQGRIQFIFTTSEDEEITVNADDGSRGMDPESSFPTRNSRVN